MESNNEAESTIVIDHGSCFIRAGFASDDTPKIIIPSVGGTKRKTVGRAMMMPMGMKPSPNVQNDVFIYGDEAIEQANIMRIEHTLEDKVNLKNSAKGLYIKVLKQLGVYDDVEKKLKSTNYKLVYIVSPFVEKIFLENVFQILFSVLNFSEICLLPNSLAVLNWAGIVSENNENADSGMVIDIGETKTDITFTSKNRILLKEYAEQLALGGRDLTNFLKEFYEDSEFFKFDSIMKVNKLKETNVSTALDYDKEVSNFNQDKIAYEVEDSKYEFGIELLTAGEVFFNPKICKKDEISLSLPEEISKYLNKIREGSNNSEESKHIEKIKICIVGGTSKIKNFKERLNLELEKLQKNFEIVNFNNLEDIVSWKGAANKVQNNLLKNLWITKLDEENFEKGYGKFYSLVEN